MKIPLTINTLLFTLLVTFTIGTGTSAAEPVAEKLLPPQEIINRLQQGGLVVYLRHAATDRSQEDQHPVDLKQCATQRNLSTAGKKQSKNIGAAFKRLAIPVSEVFASPFCRCKDTAQLAFGDYRIDHNLYFAVALEKQQRDQQTKVLKDLLSDTPDSGNRVIVSHTGNLREATGLWPKPEGVAYIFEPNEIPTPHLVGIIKPDEWNNL